jgi:hypothetical protein
MTTVLLFIICILLVWDIVMLRKIYKDGGNGNPTLTDEKYFELKYNINLLKSISAILIFVVGFLGYTSYEKFKSEFSENLNEATKEQRDNLSQVTDKQRKELDLLTENISLIKTSISELDSLKNRLEQSISDYDSRMTILNSKATKINNTLKYNPRIFVVNDIKYSVSTFRNRKNNSRDLKIFFKDLKSSFNERLPKFKKAPLVNVEGLRLTLHVMEITNEYFIVKAWSADGDELVYDRGYFTFDIWIASFD